MSTLANYRAGVRNEGYDGTTDGVLDVAINEARRDILRLHRWTWSLRNDATSLVTAVGNSLVSNITTTIADLGRIEGLRLKSGTTTYDLDWLEYQDLRDEQINAVVGSRARPEWWSRRGNELVLYPTPDAVYTLDVDYIATAADLVNPSDIDGVIPNEYRELVTWKVCKQLAFRQRDPFAISYAQENYVASLRSALDNDAKQSRSESDQVQPYWAPQTRAY